MKSNLQTIKRIIQLVFFMLAILLSSKTFGQQINLSGKVVDAINNEPLVGVTVVEKGTTNGITTDIDGEFHLLVEKGAIVSFSFVGMKNKELKVLETQEITVELDNDEVGLDEVIVTGYLKEKKADLTGSVGTIDLKKVEELPSGNIMKNIQGRVAGVQIYTDGSPGSGATVRIRGNGTLNNNDPLYVIDGVPTKSGMNELNSNDIESFQVLKDASAASIYGSRAANGVIIITTKRGKDGQTRIDFDAKLAQQFYTSKLEPLNKYERGFVFWQASVNDRLKPVSPIYKYVWNGDFNSPVLGAINYPEYIDAAKTMKPADTNWFDEISQRALMQTYNLTVSKGDKNGRSLFSLGYYNHDGIVKETNFNRINARFNSEYNLFDGLITIGENFTVSHQNEIQINAGNVLFCSLVQQPIVPVYTEDGGWGGPASGMTDRQNPVRLIEDSKQNKYTYVRPFGNAYLEIEPIKNLQLKSKLGIDYSMYYARNLSKSYVSGFLNEPDNKVSNNVNLKGNWVWTNTATYNLKAGKNNATFLAGTEQIKFVENWFDASREGLIVENMDYAYLNSGTKNQLNSGSGNTWALQSFFGKVNYSFNNKYLASLTVRRDGSSRFGDNNKYGNFPAVSAGWRISEEEFMKNRITIPYSLKVRASWGMNGNQEINDLARYTIYRTIYGKEDAIWDNPNPPVYLPNLGTAYDISGIDQGQLPSGFISTQIANEDLKWETTTQTNLGLDFSLFDKLSGSFDYFNKRTDDILYYRVLLSAVGEANGQYVNGGAIGNKGYEFILEYSDKVGDFSFDITGNLSSVKNKVVSMPENITIRMPLNGIIPNEAKTELPSSLVVGHSINSIYGYIADGLFQNQDEVTNSLVQPGKAIGRIRYKDISGPEGVADGVVDNYDQTFIAVADPKFTYGLNIQAKYKKLSLDLFLQGIQGISVYNSYKTYTDFASLWPGTNWGKRTLGAWSETNTESTIPKLTTIDSNNEGRLSTYFIENGSYLKLREIQLSYDFTGKDLRIKKLNSLKVYVQGQNLLTFKNKSFTGPDPENPNYAFPIPAMYTIGVKIGL